MAHVDVWTELWDRWLMLGDSVTIQWVPSHLEVQGNGCGWALTEAFREMVRDRGFTDIWYDLRLEEMDNVSDDSMSGWS